MIPLTMTPSNFLCIFFSKILIVCAGMVVFCSNPIFALLYLVSGFISASVLLFLLECELLALLFLIIYVGAIAVLFLFAVMMLNFKHTNLRGNSFKYMPIGVLLGAGLLPFLTDQVSAFFASGSFSTLYVCDFNALNYRDAAESLTESGALGHVVYSCFAAHVLLSGLVLLAVLLAVVHLLTGANAKQKNNSLYSDS